jgi:hypothetical protein
VAARRWGRGLLDRYLPTGRTIGPQREVAVRRIYRRIPEELAAAFEVVVGVGCACEITSKGVGRGGAWFVVEGSREGLAKLRRLSDVLLRRRSLDEADLDRPFE